jgi:hypothetical protein
MWEQRNKQVQHGQDQTTCQLANRRHIAMEFRHIQSQRANVLHADHDLSIRNNDNVVDLFIETVTPKCIENWLQVWCPVIQDSVKAATAFAL